MINDTKATRCPPASFERIILDMNTQYDLFLPRGLMPVVNRADALPNIGRIMKWAREIPVPVLSSLECRRIEASARGLPAYCIDRTLGQQKVPITLLPTRIIVQDDETANVSPNLFTNYQQVVLIKRSRDFLSNPKVDRLFHALSVHHVFVIGAVTEYSVTPTVIGLLARGDRVAVVTDACGTWSSDAGEQAMRQMAAKGAVLVTTDELISGAADDRLRSTRPVLVPDEEELLVAVAS
jgi:nicotinamidase-related amidase